MVLTKRKKMRKKLDRLTNIKKKEEKILELQTLKYFDSQLSPIDKPIRQKLDQISQESESN